MAIICKGIKLKYEKVLYLYKIDYAHFDSSKRISKSITIDELLLDFT